MTGSTSIAAIYDFELFPYALGDVLTWNVRTAMRCEELGRKQVDIYICADERYPAGIYQRGLVNPQNFDLFFSELYGAFGTHPKLGNIHIFRQREALLAKLQELVSEDGINAEAVADYLNVLEYRVSETVLNKIRRAISKAFRGNQLVREAFKRCLPSPVKTVVRKAFNPNEEAINNYFIKYIHSHESINEFAATRGGIPLLRPSLGCAPDIDELIARRFAGKKIVPFHLRLRRLDAGYGGEHSYTRDSDFLEWYDFLKEAAGRYPEVEFIALGRLQEKPLELLRLPNVTSLRIFGMGLGHELTLMLKSDLFIGTSSGFAALANFSSVPYFITHMNPGSCKAYAIPEGAERLPFAQENQKLIYVRETSELLMSLMETGLKLSGRSANQYRLETETSGTNEIDVRGWLNSLSQPMNSAATTSRFFIDDKNRQEETAYLILPSLERARQALVGNAREEAQGILRRLEKNFPDLCCKLPQYLTLKEVITDESMDPEAIRACQDMLDIQVEDFVGTACLAAAAGVDGWRPLNWTVVGSEFKPLPEESQPAFIIRATGPNSYWHTERFICIHSCGKIIVRLDAKNSVESSRHRAYIFEDGSFRSVGELVTGIEWRTFEIPIKTNSGSILEFQIDQPDASQWLSIRNFHVIGGGPLLIGGGSLPLVRQAPVAIPMAAWVGEAGIPCAETDGHDCRQWPVTGMGFVQTPVLPQPGEAGLLIRFETRTNRPAATFASIYLFEGDKYRTVAQYAFGSAWREFTLLLEPCSAAPIKVQIDYPDGVESLSIRDFQAIPVVRDKILVT
jgi:hypothetical protein